MFTPQEGARSDMIVLPLNVTIGGKTYREFEELTSAQILEMIREGNIPTSSQPSPAEIMAAYEQATENRPIIFITMADGLSGTYSTAMAARENMPNKEHITVVNSRTLCGRCV